MPNKVIWGVKVQATKELQLRDYIVDKISNDETNASLSADNLITERAAKLYANSRPGATGPAGANGANGTNGTNGATGATGPAGADGSESSIRFGLNDSIAENRDADMGYHNLTVLRANAINISTSNNADFAVHSILEMDENKAELTVLGESGYYGMGASLAQVYMRGNVGAGGGSIKVQEVSKEILIHGDIQQEGSLHTYASVGADYKELTITPFSATLNAKNLITSINGNEAGPDGEIALILTGTKFGLDDNIAGISEPRGFNSADNFFEISTNKEIYLNAYNLTTSVASTISAVPDSLELRSPRIYVKSNSSAFLTEHILEILPNKIEISGAKTSFIGGVVDMQSALTATGAIKAQSFNVSAMAAAPATATSAGVLGEIRHTSTHIYVCTATNTWKRTALATW